MNTRIDKILFLSDNNVVIYYTDRAPMTVCSDRGGALNLALYLLGLDVQILLDDDKTNPCADLTQKEAA